MMRSLYAGVSGLRSHQTMMDVVGDNIANINTPGYKGSRVVFQNTLSQVLRGGSGATDVLGGTNAQQVGLGVRVASVETINTQGPVQSTGRPTDVAIQGEGYFVVRSGSEQLFTRAGSFGFDDRGNLTDPTGAIVQGWSADAATGAVNANGPSGDIRLPLGQSIAPVATRTVSLGGNLNAKAPAGATISTAIGVIDSLGATRRVSFEYTRTADNSWSVRAIDEDGAEIGSTDLTFDADSGALLGDPSPTFVLPGKDGSTDTVFTGNFGDPGKANALTQFSSASTAAAVGQDGAATGYLRSFSIGDDGTVSGVFSNGRSKVLAQLALAGFTNPAGLMAAGSGHLRAGVSSGEPSVGLAGGVGRGTLAAGALEGSNVELAQEFTNLMIAQRGFQANSRIISTSDEMLQELVNLKR